MHSHRTFSGEVDRGDEGPSASKKQIKGTRKFSAGLPIPVTLRLIRNQVAPCENTDPRQPCTCGAYPSVTSRGTFAFAPRFPIWPSSPREVEGGADPSGAPGVLC